MEQRGSQRRYSLEECERTVAFEEDGVIILKAYDEWKFELWARKDDYAGAVIVFKGEGYEFCRDYELTYEQECKFLDDQPSVSFWLKAAIKHMEERDPCDAAIDSEILFKLEIKRLKEMGI
jgi:hypothetical protein